MKQVDLIMDSHALDLALTRITHQILERNRDLSTLGIVGMQTRGVFLARRIARRISDLAKTPLATGTLDVSFYRDDYRISLKQPAVKATDIPFDINNMNIVLVDDVLFTGRTVRAAMDALMGFGRAKSIQLAVILDRGHRELPIQPDYVGKSMVTLPNQLVSLKITENDGEDSLWLMEREKGD
ncbi:MAG: bifunctional pyr operon transcriptional regulator/uracil phosphoribosyltransferase PyrR [Chitinispirillaceae bacterium]|jgi:pyrimidine operon attenuation protein/uracil phosphoribosyltransferase|nr:bifunctional pyr operon transcriptional regulator/uracil phosphoribosyltransferase PyrR [Chitinispirillaceae bacterium]